MLAPSRRSTVRTPTPPSPRSSLRRLLLPLHLCLPLHLLLLQLALLPLVPLAGCATATDDPELPPSTSDASTDHALEIAAGLHSARARGCTACHDAGDGTPAGRLDPLPGSSAFPSNLTSDWDTGLGAWSDEQIARAIHDGVDDSGQPLCAAMPRYDRIAGPELHALVTWIRSLAPVHREVPESSCDPENSDGGLLAATADASLASPLPDLACRDDAADDAASNLATPDSSPLDRDLSASSCDLAVAPPDQLAAPPPDLSRPAADLSSRPADLSLATDLTVAADAASPPDAALPRCGARINELQTAGAGGASDEFIELYNPCPASVDLDGSQLVYRAAAGVADVILLKLPALKLAPAGRLLLGGPGFPGAADLHYGGSLAADGGGLALREAGGALGDHLGWGTARNAFVRGTAAPAPPAALSINRHPDGADSGDDARDFAVNFSTPGKPNR